MAYGDPGHEDDLIEFEREAERFGYTGDARRCPRHPHVRTSSADGMFDGLCGECEAAMDQAAMEDEG